MYAWGGSATDWRGSGSYDYGSARARYDKSAKDAGVAGKARTYDRRREPDMKLVDPRGKEISSKSTDPVIIAVDVTGSMNTWPGEIFDRLPLLYQTLAKYRPEVEFSFAAIGDATCDSYPLQVSEFTKEIKDLEANLKALGCEGGGGGQIMESYELFGHFMANHCKTPNATSPFLLIYGDEAFYDRISKKQVKHFIGEDLESEIDSDKVWKGLLQRFDLYFLQKPYGSGGDVGTTAAVKERWAKAIGLQRIIDLPSRDRAVDVGMGLIAKHWGEYRDFGKSLDARHDDSNVKASVHHSLRHIDPDPSAKSVTKLPKKSELSNPLD